MNSPLNLFTYSGYENNVKTNLEKMIENRGLQDMIFEIVVPMEEQIEIKDGKTKSTIRKVFPGYVLIKMIMTDETWYVVRNTHAVTSFVGSGTKPIPLTDEEMKKIESLEKNNRLVKGHVFLWEGAKDWHDLWDEDGVIVK